MAGHKVPGSDGLGCQAEAGRACGRGYQASWAVAGSEGIGQAPCPSPAVLAAPVFMGPELRAGPGRRVPTGRPLEGLLGVPAQRSLCHLRLVALAPGAVHAAQRGLIVYSELALGGGWVGRCRASGMWLWRRVEPTVCILWCEPGSFWRDGLGVAPSSLCSLLGRAPAPPVTGGCQAGPGHLRSVSGVGGEHLRICPQGYTCCTSEMEENLANRSRAELETALLDSAHALQATLATQLQSFDDHFQQLLNESERALQDAFPGAFGELYTQGAKAFRDLYAELRLYYRGANLHLEDTLAEFWARLLERLFRQLHPQLLLPDDYLDCLGKQADALRPFGEAPRELRLRATRAFVAARAFVQGLGVAGDVVRKVAQVPLGPECSRAVMKLAYCAHCLGVPGARPCPDYCRNVLKGCLANQADLDAEWRNLLDSMVLITDKFWGPSGAESVIGGVHLWLAEAINALQDNRDILTAKVIQGCGNPKVNPQGSGPEEKRRQGKLVLQEKPPTGTLEKLVSEAKTQLRDAQDFWISLPGMLCSEKMAMSSASDDRCWNGMAKGRYLPEVMGDGLANQINNPEVEVDITKPDMTVRQQIMQLKVMTNRLRGAYSGNDVDFQDASDDSSGSGSGDSCPDDLCDRRVSKKSSSSRTTLTHALPGLSEREGQKTSAASCPQPCASLPLLLLSLVLSAARPTWR